MLQEVNEIMTERQVQNRMEPDRFIILGFISPVLRYAVYVFIVQILLKIFQYSPITYSF